MKKMYPEIIYLCGFSGSGKTVCGEILSDLIGYSFRDSDSVIESKIGKTIPEIFSEEGESRFREIERDVIQTISRVSDRVVSLGGGALLTTKTFEQIKEAEKKVVLVYLQATLESLDSRLKKSHQRPLLGSPQYDREETDRVDRMRRIESLFKEREKQYLQADIIIATDRKTPDQVAGEIKDELTRYV